jgi:hypothetical protein
LLPKSSLFAAKELRAEGTLRVGKSVQHLVLEAGPWTIWLGLQKEGRFPRIDDHVRQPSAAVSRLQISESDAAFLTRALPRLPCDETYNGPLTLDLNGEVTIRGRASEQAEPTELVLAGSRYSGRPIRISTNRAYLSRALALGFREVLVYGPEAPVLCQDGLRHYGWALLDPAAAIKPSESAIRLSSAPAQAQAAAGPRRRPSQASPGKTAPPPDAATQAAPTARPTSPAAAPAASECDLVGTAEALRDALREHLTQARQLVAALRTQRKGLRKARARRAPAQPAQPASV